jgi:hypothetical protein
MYATIPTPIRPNAIHTHRALLHALASYSPPWPFWPPTEMALLPLRVKRGLLGLHLLHQFFDPINRKLVVNRNGYAFVVLDLVVKFYALVTHFRCRIRG